MTRRTRSASSKPAVRRVISSLEGADGALEFRLLDSAHTVSNDLPVFVLIHGIGMSHRYLESLHDRLAERARVISIDLPGFGGLPKPSWNPDVAAMARGIADALRQYDLQRVVLVGHSMGAQWAVEAAAQHPDFVHSVVAMGPVADAAHRTVGAQARALALDTLREKPGTNLIVFGDYFRAGISWYLAQLRHMLAYGIEDRVAVLRVPLLVIRGEADPVAGAEWCEYLCDTAPDGEMKSFDGSHVVQRFSPEAVAEGVLQHAVRFVGPPERER